MTDPSIARRVHPRLSFAGRLAPRLEALDRTYEIVDLSPAGVRIRTSSGLNGMTIGALLTATIRFPADHTVEILGRVLRVDGGEAAVQLERGHEALAGLQPVGPMVQRRTGMLW